MENDHFSVVKENKVYDIYSIKIVKIDYNASGSARRKVVRLTQKEFEDLKALYIFSMVKMDWLQKLKRYLN